MLLGFWLQVSPLGFYQFEEEEEDEEDEEEEQNEIVENPDFEEPKVGEMVDSLSTWVHRTRYILPQVRMGQSFITFPFFLILFLLQVNVRDAHISANKLHNHNITY